MSEEGDIDVESAEDVPDIAVEATATTVEDRSDVYSPTGGPVDKRAHHNALERRRRDHIKDSFHGLRDSIPSLHGEKISRAHILNKATDYIRVMQKSGLSREHEIQDLKRKNEVLEEQVRALEAARALGSSETAEDILQSVAEKVESRQRQQQQQQNKANSTATTTSGKPERNNSIDKSAGKGSQQSSGGSSKQPAPVVVKGGGTSNPLANHMSILAKNQSLLSALQKNLSSPNLSDSIKSLAARVLASPLGRAQASTGGNIPRGIVTATTVPKGSSFTSSPLPNTLQQQLQQQSKPNQTHTKSITGTPSKLPTANATTPVLPSTNEHASPVIPNCTSNTHTASLSNPDKTAVDSTSPLSQTTSSDNKSGSKAEIAGTSSATTSSSLTTSANPTPVTASSLASQLLDAHSLLQQQGAGTGNSSSPIANSAAAIPLISPELLAQVSSFLNVPGQGASQPDASESVAVVSAASNEISASEPALQDSLSADASLQGVKRPSSSQELDSEHSMKKIHLEA